MSFGWCYFPSQHFMQFPVFYLEICAYFVKLQNSSELDADIEVFTPASVDAHWVEFTYHIFCTLLTTLRVYMLPVYVNVGCVYILCVPPYICCIVIRVNSALYMLYFAFSVLTLLVGRQEGHPACKTWVVGCWHGYPSGARCWLAYGPADATATHCLLLQ